MSGSEAKSGSLSAAAAIVTSRRVLIVGPDLTLKAATPQRTNGATVTSALWVGPALLFCDSAGAVSTPGHCVLLYPLLQCVAVTLVPLTPHIMSSLLAGDMLQTERCLGSTMPHVQCLNSSGLHSCCQLDRLWSHRMTPRPVGVFAAMKLLCTALMLCKVRVIFVMLGDHMCWQVSCFANGRQRPVACLA